MRRFNITVNGQAYDVAVEELAAGAAPVAAPAPAAAPVAAPAAPVAAPAAPAAAPAPASTTGSVKVEAPMPGGIISIKVKPGDVVKKDQVLLVLEAMKMENDIPSPADGVVAGVHVSTGDTVNAGALLISLQ